MAEPKTQDKQKVRKSAVQNLESFLTGVNPPSSSKNMATIYKNMGKMFNAFTKGVLVGQGADSEYILTQIYRQLNDDFLKIVQNEDAVDKIVDYIKGKQDVVKTNKNKVAATETLVKVVEDKLDPNTCNLTDVILDFSQELQNGILTVRQQLAREYDKQKMSIDALKNTVKDEPVNLEDGEPTIDIETLNKQQQELDAKLSTTKKLLDTFNKAVGGESSELTEIQTFIQDNQTFKTIIETRTNFDPNKMVDKIKQSSEVKPVEPKEERRKDLDVESNIEKKEVESKVEIKQEKDKKEEKTTVQEQKTIVQEPKPVNKDSDSVSKLKVQQTLGKMNQNLTKLVGDDKFRKHFMLNSPQIQKAVFKQLNKVDKYEAAVQKDIVKTQKGIKLLQKGQSKNWLLRLIFRPNWAKIAIIAVGALLIIGFTRLALKKFKETYMPDTQGEEFTLFGVPIPGYAEMKSLGLGLLNFITVGIPNAFGKLSNWFSGLKKKLFGKKGILSNAAEMKATLKKIAAAYLIGHTKKAGGWIVFKLLMFVAKLIPGWGTALSFLAEFAPAIYTFIATQIALMMANKQADAETRMEDLKKNFSEKKIAIKLYGAAKHVKPLVQGPAIPGLQSPKPSKSGKYQGRTAIMRRAGKNVTRYKTDSNVQDAQYKQETDSKTLTAHYEKLRNENVKGLVNQLNYAGSQWTADFEVKRVLDTFIHPEIAKLDLYIDSLKKSTRFSEKQSGLLYDVNTGWNPYYTVRQSDLFTPIPLTPFGKIHEKADIPFGEPSPGESSYIGIMPFTWIQNEVQVSANPLQMELERAQGIRRLWLTIKNDVINSNRGYGYDENGRKQSYGQDYILNAFSKYYDPTWRKYNFLTKGMYGSNVFYGDKFVKFLDDFRKGNISADEDNTIDVAKGTAEIKYKPGKSPEFGKHRIKNDDEYDTRAKSTGWTLTKIVTGGWRTGDDNRNRSKEAMKTFRELSFFGLNYGDLRDFFLDDGILSMFNVSQMVDPITKANTLVKSLLDRNYMFNGTDEKDAPPLHHFVWKVLDSLKISDYTWATLKEDRYSQAGFSQSLLEYFAYKVLPQWDVVEQLLIHVMSNDGDGTPNLVKAIKSLMELMQTKSIITFVGEHLRFTHTIPKVINDLNASKEQQAKLDKFRKSLGIPTAKEKIEILKELAKPYDSSPDKLNDRFNYLSKLLERAKFEARATGDHTYENQILHYFNEVHDKLANVRNTGATDTTIVQTPTGIQKVVEPIAPIKTEEEKRAEALKKKEEEARRKREQEEEKKRKLEAEAKRKEELIVAQARIAAAEAIKKQEQAYETVLQKMLDDPTKITAEEMKTLEKDIDKIKQDAENRISQLPREKRELKLALIRGDKISPKTFTEMKETAIGLHGSLEAYIGEVNQIPCGSIISIGSPQPPPQNTIPMNDPDNIDLGDD